MKIFYFSIFLLISTTLKAQNFNGQWKGGFTESSYGFAGLTSNDISYVLEIQTNGTNVTGYSYTYFSEGAKKLYTICRLTGTLDKALKEITVTEVERVKYNTPPDFQNCFQTHKLHYTQDTANEESLRGTWAPAPNQTSNCGYGSTFLSRRIIKKTPLIIAKTEDIKTETKPVTIIKKPAIALKPKINSNNTKPITKATPKPHKEEPSKLLAKQDNIQKDIPSIIPDIKNTDTIKQNISGFEIRRRDILKTIPITQSTFKVDFYDNGEVDGDSITVFYNNKIIVSHKMLTTNAISLTLSLNENIKQNIITMYADNLGTIPPNTALMVVTDGDKRYEVRISSDTEKSGSVIFVHGQ